MDFPTTFAEARPRLTARPVGRAGLGIRRLHLALEQAWESLDAVLPVAGDVSVGLVLDGSLAVSDGMLRQWGVTLDQAVAASFEVHGGEDPRIEQVDGAVLVTDRSFAAFLLRSSDAARRLVAGTPVAFVPTDRHVVLAAGEDPRSVWAAARVAERVLQGEEPAVAGGALVADRDGWRQTALPPDVESAASELARRFAARTYAEQRPLLQAFYDGSGQRCFVAGAVLARRPDKVVELVATITEGVPTALPWVDVVSLVRGGAVVGMVPMPALAAAAGVLIPMPDLDPPRWYPTRFPGEFAR